MRLRAAPDIVRRVRVLDELPPSEVKAWTQREGRPTTTFQVISIDINLPEIQVTGGR